MTGHRPIVVNIANSYQFAEHEDIAGAKREAHRLAASVGSPGPFVVYVPVAVIDRTPPTRETPVDLQSVGLNDNDLPF